MRFRQRVNFLVARIIASGSRQTAREELLREALELGLKTMLAMGLVDD